MDDLMNEECLLFSKLRECDVDDALRIETESFAKPWPRHAFEEAVDKKDLDFFTVLDENDKVIAQTAVYYIAGEEGDIMNVAVDKKYRNKGICEKLIAHIISECHNIGIDELTLEVRAGNDAAVHVYEKSGFVTEGVRKDYYSEPTEDALIMWRHGTIESKEE